MIADQAEYVRQRLQSDLREAMKARDRAKIDVLRILIAAIDNAGAIALDGSETPAYARNEGRSQHVVTGAGRTEVTRRALTPEDITQIFVAEAAERRGTAENLERHSRPSEAAALRESAAFIEAYLGR